jgi:DNA-binding FadR family transcriptional regulator
MRCGTPDECRVVQEHRQIYKAMRRPDAHTAQPVMVSHLHGSLNSGMHLEAEEPEIRTAVAEGTRK